MKGIDAALVLKERWMADKSIENTTAYDAVLYAYDNEGHWEECAIEFYEYFASCRASCIETVMGISDKYTNGEEYYRLCKEIEGVMNDYRLG